MTSARAHPATAFHRAPPSIIVVTWILLPFVAAHVVLASISGYRAIVQVYRVTIGVPRTTLGPGDTVTMSVVTSGRTPVDAELVLEQEGVIDTLAVLFIRDHENPSYDPRPIPASVTTVLKPDHLRRFRGGQATLRAIGNGRSQWLRVPPPVVQRADVTLQP